MSVKSRYKILLICKLSISWIIIIIIIIIILYIYMYRYMDLKLLQQINTLKPLEQLVLSGLR